MNHGCEDAQCPDYAGYIVLKDGTRVSLGTDQIDPNEPQFTNIQIDPNGKGWEELSNNNQ